MTKPTAVRLRTAGLEKSEPEAQAPAGCRRNNSTAPAARQIAAAESSNVR